MANKAGLVVAGAAKVAAAIETGAVAGLIQARDGGADGARKLQQALTRRFGEAASKVPRIELFASCQLDLALGRTNVIHAALETGAASEAFLARCRRLAAYRGAPSGGRGAGIGRDNRSDGFARTWRWSAAPIGTRSRTGAALGSRTYE